MTLFFFLFFQIIIEGEGFLNNEMSVAVDDVILTTEKCSLIPYFAKPGKCLLRLLLFVTLVSVKYIKDGNFCSVPVAAVGLGLYYIKPCSHKASIIID